MRTFACLAVASCLSLAPALAAAQDAPPVVITPPPAGATVIVVPAAGPYAAPAPVWQGTHAPDPVVMRHRNKGLMIGGLVMIPVGLAMAIGGGVWASDINRKPSTCEPSSDHTLGGALGAGIGAAVCGIGVGLGRAMGLGLAYTLTAGGVMMSTGGIVMAAIGGSKVPAKPRWQPDVSVGAGSMSMRWTF